MRYRTLLAASAITSALVSGAWAQTLTIGLPTAPTSIDPLYQQIGSNHELSIHMFDTLLRMDPTMQVLPGLALEWGPTEDPSVWQFKLRDDVTFHNGEKFTAHDVVFSFRRALEIPGAPATYSRLMAQVDTEKTEAIDDTTLHVHTKGAFPLLPRMLAGLPIVSRSIGPDALPAQFNDGTLTYGTGPYRFVEYLPADRLIVEANPEYWGDAPKWKRVVFRFVSSGPARTASLLAGDVDLISAVATTDVPVLEANPAFDVACTASTRLIHWAMDVSRDVAQHITAKDGSEIANPLRDLRVRQAISIAIDRDAIVETVMNGLAIKTNQFVAKGFAGYNPDVQPPEHDLVAARALMAEAGLADGFRMTIHATNDRYVNDSAQSQALAQMLARIGIEVEVITQPVANFFNRAREREFTFNMVGFAAVSGEASSIMSPVLVSGSLNNYGGWESEDFNRVYAAALDTVDIAEHDALLLEAVAIAMADVPVIPTHTQVACWATRAGLEMTPYSDEYTRADVVAVR
ncbi:ABC transporter substrate-binding protein [Yoonia sp.]|uniref:ABC transporter substrate-binding protein n=1 Tax=Yoonia sp. TaxID=2212373 RepID=UPI0040483147